MITRLKNSSRRNVAQTIVYAMLLSFVMACYAIGDEYELTVEVVDAENQQPLAARLYLRSSTGDWHYFTATDKRASAVRYEKQNWINKRSIEYHTTVSAHPVSTRVPAGDYQLTVEKGKSYLPQTVDLAIESNGTTTLAWKSASSSRRARRSPSATSSNENWVEHGTAIAKEQSS